MGISPGELVLLYCEDGKKYLLQLKEGWFHTHKDSVNLSEVLEKEFGDEVLGKNGTTFYILKPSLEDVLVKVERLTQIIYPKDIGIILLKLSVSCGSRVIECGTGSGALTCALAWAVGDTGKVYSYEREERFQKIARKNLEKLGFSKRVDLKLKEVTGDFDEKEVDAVFLDVREPWLLIDAAKKSLKPGHSIGILVPTTNQVSETLRKLLETGFVDLEVIEVMLRAYKVNPDRLRPEDRMVAHTGYLIFGKALK